MWGCQIMNCAHNQRYFTKYQGGEILLFDQSVLLLLVTTEVSSSAVKISAAIQIQFHLQPLHVGTHSYSLIVRCSCWTSPPSGTPRQRTAVRRGTPSVQVHRCDIHKQNVVSWKSQRFCMESRIVNLSVICHCILYNLLWHTTTVM
jgi:hypothetical protein